ncbi:ECF transporter S component [Oscillatoria laete-virens NRMC-F 0139]|nr:ECF transporter S component [Oscillatoria laete-virens]MDL5055375.1 ECF transporter S component [Oscillatoria laete-virens NRMC-F 0139]
MVISKHLEHFERQIRSCGRKFCVTALVLIALYLLIGNARSVQPNPFVTGGTIAVNMIVPVLAGVLFGRWMGLVVGFVSSLLNGIIPGLYAFGNEIEAIDILAAVPHALMGFLAGVLARRFSDLIAFTSLFAGHVMNLTAFCLGGIMTFAELKNSALWGQIMVETLVGIMACMIMAALYRLAFLSPKRELTEPCA